MDSFHKEIIFHLEDLANPFHLAKGFYRLLVNHCLPSRRLPCYPIAYTNRCFVYVQLQSFKERLHFNSVRKDQQHRAQEECCEIVNYCKF